jgi:hypothetical protein
MRRNLLLIAVVVGGCLAWTNQRSEAAEDTRTSTPQVGIEAGEVGMIPDDARYLRENRAAGQIVGGAVSGVGALRGQGTQTGQGMQGMQGFPGTTRGFGTMGGFNQFGGFGGMGTLGQMGRMFGGAMNSRNTRTRQNLRASVELGFNAPPAQPPVVVGARVQQRIASIPRIQEMGSVNIEMEGQTAVLRGQVATAQDRELVARMLLLEPGISDVRNELTFAPSNDPAAQP